MITHIVRAQHKMLSKIKIQRPFYLTGLTLALKYTGIKFLMVFEALFHIIVKYLGCSLSKTFSFHVETLNIVCEV